MIRPEDIQVDDVLNFGTAPNYHVKGIEHQGSNWRFELQRDDGFDTYATDTDLDVANKLPEITVGEDTPVATAVEPVLSAQYQVHRYKNGEPSSFVGSFDDYDAAVQHAQNVAAEVDVTAFVADRNSGDILYTTADNGDPETDANNGAGASQDSEVVQVDTDDETTTSTTKSRKGK